MRDDNKADQQTSTIERAKRKREQWKAAAVEDRRRVTFTHLPADELIELAENMSKLTWPELEALDEAWHGMFGELIVFPELVPGTAKTTAPENNEPELPDDTIIHVPEVLRRIGVSPSTLYRMRTEGRFPAAIELTGKSRIGWRLGDIKAWADE